MTYTCLKVCFENHYYFILVENNNKLGLFDSRFTSNKYYSLDSFEVKYDSVINNSNLILCSHAKELGFSNFVECNYWDHSLSKKLTKILCKILSDIKSWIKFKIFQFDLFSNSTLGRYLFINCSKHAHLFSIVQCCRNFYVT